MAKENKSKIIEQIFRARLGRGRLENPVVTLDDVQKAIHEFNRKPENKNTKLSSRNPANFFKDFIRVTKAANKNWPKYVFDSGYTAEQVTGEGMCFKFIKLKSGQATAFIDSSLQYPKDPAQAKFEIVQTLSIPLPNKVLSREDENWLQQISVSLNLPQQHLALHMIAKLMLIEVSFMQSNLKQNKAEIDGLFFGRLEGNRCILITMEAKGSKDDILETQILKQVQCIPAMDGLSEALDKLKYVRSETRILPMAMKVVSVDKVNEADRVTGYTAVGDSIVYMASFNPIPLDLAEKITGKDLELKCETLFDLRPPISGIN